MSRNRSTLGRCRRLVSGCALLGLVLAAGTVSAQRSGDTEAAFELQRLQTEPRARAVQDDGPISLDEAVELVRSEFEGRVVSAETRSVDGRRVHVIRIYDDVSVREILVDEATGRIRRR